MADFTADPDFMHRQKTILFPAHLSNLNAARLSSIPLD
jgi:hypothetical protein